jgi:hypothetical protein
MGTTRNEIETTVRRKGGLDTVYENTSDKVPQSKRFSGNRRSRQIAKRHWFQQRTHGYCSYGSAWDCTTVKSPGKNEHELHTSRWELR